MQLIDKLHEKQGARSKKPEAIVFWLLASGFWFLKTHCSSSAKLPSEVEVDNYELHPCGDHLVVA